MRAGALPSISTRHASPSIAQPSRRPIDETNRTVVLTRHAPSTVKYHGRPDFRAISLMPFRSASLRRRCLARIVSSANATATTSPSSKLAPVSTASVNLDPQTLTLLQNTILKTATSSPFPSLFFSGKAGSGKSHLLHHIIHSLRSQNRHVAVTAMTGIAASHLPFGTTFHAFSGLSPDLLSDMHYHVARYARLSPRLIGELVRGVTQNGVVYRLMKTDCIVVDECSMMSPVLLDTFSEVLKKVRGSSEEMGGVQMILTGDFCQLPPIDKEVQRWEQEKGSRVMLKMVRDEVEKMKKEEWQRMVFQEGSMSVWGSRPEKIQLSQDQVGKCKKVAMDRYKDFLASQPSPETQFCFDAKSWPLLFKDRIYVLDRVFRQDQDPLFCDVLNFLRTAAPHDPFSQKYFPVVDAILRHLQLDFHHRHSCPFFQNLPLFKSLDDVFPYIRPLSTLSTPTTPSSPLKSLHDLGSFELDLPKIASISPNDSLSSDHTINDNIQEEVEPIRLFPCNAPAHRLNMAYLSNLPPPTYRYNAIDSIPLPNQPPPSLFPTTGPSQSTSASTLMETGPTTSEETKSNGNGNVERMYDFTLPSTVLLRVGAKVMVLKNMCPELGLVNGRIGEVIGFEGVPVDVLESGTGESSVSVSGSGSGRDIENCKDGKEEGRGDGNVVILPRVRFPISQSPELLRNTSFVKVGSHFIDVLVPPSHESRRIPTTPSTPSLTTSPGTITIPPDPSSMETEKDVSTRTQLPLQLAYAYSIHRSQGQTLPRITVSLKDVFARGHTYVALSRVKRMVDVVVSGYDSEKGEEGSSGRRREKVGDAEVKEGGRKRVWRYGQEGKVIQFYQKVENKGA